MTTLLQSHDPEASLLVRTYFGSEDDWLALVDEATRPYGPEGFGATFEAISDPQYEGCRPEELAAATAPSTLVAFAADADSMEGPEKTLIVIGCLPAERGRWFRVPLPLAWVPQNNLSLGNMDFREFERACVDGVYRGF